MRPVPDLADHLRAAFRTGLTRPVAWRRAQLRELAWLLRREAGALTDAMATDLGKPELEGWLTDVAVVRRDIDGIARHLSSWAASRRAAVPWTLWPGRAEVVPEPLGAVLVIGPWNYPVRCLVLPLAFAIAAGNTAAVKPSELAPATSALLAELIPSYLDQRVVAVAEGGPEVAESLLRQRWDHIFFTGGGRVGRLVMAAAARHLTTVTLELGGKNPAIVDHSADLEAAARRIVWGRFLNAGQTCVAPDYVLVHRTVEEPLLDALVREISTMYGADPRLSPAFGRVVNDAHMRRLVEMLEATKGRLVTGGSADASERYLSPTVLSEVAWDDAVMQNEIFGPILPVLSYDSIDDALSAVNERDKPLALYVYSGDADLVDQVIAQSSSGSVCVNHNAVQLAVPALPFGGVGASGMGVYQGKAGFETFSHIKPVLYRPQRAEAPLMYPPYTRAKRWVLRKVL
ncbi:MAG TPA: aldehyde dehydrogenase family protein [Acidimicrobiales bacterium]|nr:aldehyde dehydrogenase family protein [Acidimicrobiales bacterium]